MPALWNMSVVEGSSIMLMPPVTALPWDRAHSLPALAATKEDEQAVSMATAGPFSPKWYEIRPESNTLGVTHKDIKQ